MKTELVSSPKDNSKLLFCFECLKKFPKIVLVKKNIWHYKSRILSKPVLVCPDCNNKYGLTLGRP